MVSASARAWFRRVCASRDRAALELRSRHQSRTEQMAAPPANRAAPSKIFAKKIIQNRHWLWLNPARRRQDAINGYVMRLNGNFGDNLLIESYPAFDAARVSQQLVIKPFPPNEPAT